MDSYEDYLSPSKYTRKYQKYIERGTLMQIPWSLSISKDNWNNDTSKYPIWAIELLPENTKAHSIYPLLECNKELYDQENEVQFESNTIFQITSVSTRDDFLYIQMREINDKKIFDNMCIKLL